MARIKYSKVYLDQVELFKKVAAKDLLDGSASIIRPTMVQNEITIAGDQVSVDDSVAANKIFLAQEKLAKQLTGEIKKKYDPYMKFYRGSAQFLKGFYGAGFLSLGDWGFTITVNGKMIYSKNVKDNCDSIQAMITYHLTFAVGTSPLQPFLDENNYDVAAIALDLPNVKTLFDDHLTAWNSQNAHRMTRDNLIKPVMQHLRLIGAFLKKNFISIPQNVGKWGYTVVMEPGDPKETNLDLHHSETKIIYGVINGSDLINTKTSIIKAYKGKTATGTPIVIGPGETIIVPKTWGTMTLVNQSSSIIGGITYLRG